MSNFVDGLLIKKPKPGTPDFVKLNISIKRKELIAWLEGKNDEWVNLDVKQSKQGKLYAQENTWKPKERKPEAFDDFPF